MLFLVAATFLYDLRCVFVAQGKELHALVSASKMHADRLSHLEQELLELRTAEEEAHTRHTDHINGLGALRSKHDHHKVGYVSEALIVTAHEACTQLARSRQFA